MWHDLVLQLATAADGPGPDDTGHFAAILAAATTVLCAVIGGAALVLSTRGKGPEPKPPEPTTPPHTIAVDAGWGPWAQGELNRLTQELAEEEARRLRMEQWLRALGYDPDQAPPLHHV